MTIHDQAIHDETIHDEQAGTVHPPPDAPTATADRRTETESTETESPTSGTLFTHDDLSGLRSRWDGVQASFVDDPRACVQQADALVGTVVEQLTSGFSDVRSRLEAQWARGEDASTEDLRLALRRYREFFRRLLAV